MSDAPSSTVYSFAGFLLDARRRLLLAERSGETVALSTKAFDTLLYLVEHAGDVVRKADLLRAVWPGVVVEENNLSQCVSALRGALGEDPRAHEFIVTVPGRGYRFVAEVSRVTPSTRKTPPPLTTPPIEGREPVTLAVLPFKPLSASAANDALDLGMADALIARIGALRNVRVAPLSSVRRYTDAEDPLAAGRALGVSRVLEGSLQRHGDRLRVSARLLDVEAGAQLWADRFDEPLADIFTIQDTIAERVADAVLDTVTGGDRQRLRRRPTQDALAYQSYVNGWSALTRPSGANLEQGLRHLEQAVQRDPDFALAYVCMADCWALFGVFGLRPPHDAFPRAREAVLRALAIEPELAEAHAELAHILWVYELDAPRAERALRRALEIDPQSAMAHHYLGLSQLIVGNFEEALTSLRRAQAAEPLAVNINTNIGMIHYYARRYDEAIAQAQAALELDRRFDHAYSIIGRSLVQTGHYEAAIEQFRARKGVTIGDDADVPTAYALSGDKAAARRELERLLAERDWRFVSPHAIATIYAALGDKEAALDWLDRAFDERAQPIGFVLVDPLFDGFHDEPRFKRLLEKLHLE
jgi:DNA-binding winged helix-turn-helix (wHTH) protein/tetratricopeptide (TPR) repeat protein